MILLVIRVVPLNTRAKSQLTALYGTSQTREPNGNGQICAIKGFCSTELELIKASLTRSPSLTSTERTTVKGVTSPLTLQKIRESVRSDRITPGNGLTIRCLLSPRDS